jgi:hypothetical protein
MAAVNVSFANTTSSAMQRFILATSLTNVLVELVSPVRMLLHAIGNVACAWGVSLTPYGDKQSAAGRRRIAQKWKHE